MPLFLLDRMYKVFSDRRLWTISKRNLGVDPLEYDRKKAFKKNELDLSSF